MISKVLPEKLSNQAFIDLIVRQMRDYLPRLDADRASDVLIKLKALLDENISGIAEFDCNRRLLIDSIAVCVSCSELGQVHDRLNALEIDRFLKIPSVVELHKSCTEYRDYLATRAVELTVCEMTENGTQVPDLPFALLSTGSDGREEQTLITDQDYLLVYGDGGGEEADEWFRCFSEILVERLVEVGFKKCTGDIMPNNQTWRGSIRQWRKRLISIVRYEYDEYAKNLMNLIVLSDARHVTGNSSLAKEFVELVRYLEKDSFQVLWGMAKAATNMKLALGFLKRIWTEGDGEHKGEFNLKLLGWAPLVMNIRVLAINRGIPATSTLRRIELLQQEGRFSAEMAADLSDAYHVLTRHRIILQIKEIKGIQRDSYYLNPYMLDSEDREQIRQSLLRISDLQKVIDSNFHIV